MPQPSIAAFITPHGYGHAARLSAVLGCLQQHLPGLRVELFTQVPAWFFQESLPGEFGYHSLACDIGLEQASPLQENLPATLSRLASFLPFSSELAAELVDQLTALHCQWILCDVAALGIAVARSAKLPSVLLENFTWDWIYQAYQAYPALSGPIAYLRSQYAQVDIHIQAEPVCLLSPHADFIANPISRSPRTPAEQIRDRLGLSSETKAVLVTAGGITGEDIDWSRLPVRDNVLWIIPGGANSPQRQANRLLLPHHSAYYHPDLLHACDAVIGKAGYSTLAETYSAGIPFVFLSRPTFPESAILSHFIIERMRGFELQPGDIATSGWVEELLRLASQPRIPPLQPNGADQVAAYLQDIFL